MMALLAGTNNVIIEENSVFIYLVLEISTNIYVDYTKRLSHSKFLISRYRSTRSNIITYMKTD